MLSNNTKIEQKKGKGLGRRRGGGGFDQISTGEVCARVFFRFREIKSQQVVRIVWRRRMARC